MEFTRAVVRCVAKLLSLLTIRRTQNQTRHLKPRLNAYKALNSSCCFSLPLCNWCS